LSIFYQLTKRLNDRPTEQKKLQTTGAVTIRQNDVSVDDGGGTQQKKEKPKKITILFRLAFRF
jgi:hypothetical protein